MNTEREPLPEVTTIEELQAAGYLVFKIKGGYVAVKAASEPIPGIAFEVNGRRYTADEANDLFNTVCNTKHWKLPWSAAVHHSLVAAVMKAVEYFHADVPEVIGIQPLTGLVILEGHGYQAD